MRIFISSTFNDLKNHRSAVIDALRPHADVVSMEHWTADVREPQTVSQDKINGCDLVVLIVARRRGFVPRGKRRSITQLEYDFAKSRSIDVLPFLLNDDESNWPDVFDERASDPGLKKWRDKLKSNHCTSFFEAAPETLGSCVIHAVLEWKQRSQSARNLTSYFQSIEAEFGALRILGVAKASFDDGSTSEQPDERLCDLFVEPSLSDRPLSKDPSQEELESLPSLTTVLTQYNRLIILGDPGSGKSSLISWLAWQFAVHNQSGGRQHALPQFLRSTQAEPILILPLILRDIRLMTSFRWQHLYSALLSQRWATSLRELPLSTYLHAGRAFFLIDGLDEVVGIQTRRTLRSAIQQGMREYPNCHWILTSRAVGYDDVPFDIDEDAAFRREGFGTLHGTRQEPERVAKRSYLAPFDDQRITQFATHWYQRQVRNAAVSGEVASFVKCLKKDCNTLSLARNPYLLSLMTVVHKVDAHLPNGKAKLYDKIAELFLYTMQAAKNLPIPFSAKIEDMKRWLAEVAMSLQRRRNKDDKEMLAGKDEVRKWLATAMNAGADDPRPEKFLYYVAHRGGLLFPRGHDHDLFAFIHLSFQEYFAACYLLDDLTGPDGIAQSGDQLIWYADQPWWQETLVFLCELLATHRIKWLNRILDAVFGERLAQIEPGVVHSCRVTLLARLAVDPHSGLSSTIRDEALLRCCRWECEYQKMTAERSMVFPTLFTWGHDSQALLETIIIEAERAAMSSLCLENCAITDVMPLSRLEVLRTLSLAGTGVTDISPLSNLKNLSSLVLSDSNISHLSSIEGMSALGALNISGTRLTDLSPLSQLSNLWWLGIDRTPVTDLRPLAKIKTLRFVFLRDTTIDPDRVTQLQRELPRCAVVV